MSFKRGQLLYFVTVAEEGQLTRAAKKLHLAQPALSQAISALESELGLELLERHARGVSLTPAGSLFLEKARAALSAGEDAALTAQALARAASSTLKIGFLGVPPPAHAPELFEAFARVRPDVDLEFRELPFPNGSTAAWLAEVDVALCHPPAAEPAVDTQPFRSEPRVAVLPRSHPLAGRNELAVAELFDEKFLGFDPSVQPHWAGFWHLNDQRGAPARMTEGSASKGPELFAQIASGGAIATLASFHAQVITKILSNVVAIPLADAEPAMLVLAWRTDNPNPLVRELLAVAREVSTAAPGL